MADATQEIVLVNPPAGETSQPEDESLQWTPDEAIAPPEDFERLARLTGVSPIRGSCIAAIVLNTVGLGVEVVPRKGREEDVQEDEPAKVLATLNSLSRRDVRSHRPDFKGLLERVRWDRQEVGNGYIEVARNRLSGEISGLFHVPGKRIRRLKNRDGWVWMTKSGTEAEKVRFYNFGEKVQYDGDGKATGTLVAGKGRRWDVNELIVFQRYTSESRDYGLPPDVQLVWDYLGDQNAAEANVGYFDSSGVPPTVITVQGEQTDAKDGKVKLTVPRKTVEGIVNTLSASAGRRHRVAVIAVPPGTKTDQLNLAQLSDRDLGFVGFRSDNRRRTLGAWRLSPIFVSDIDDAGKYTAEVERAITKEQVFDPEQAECQEVLSQSILRDLGFSHLTLDFHEIEIQSAQEKQAAAEQSGTVGVITNGEYREAHGYAPLPEAQENEEPAPGQVPFGWNSQLVKPTQMPVAPAGTTVVDESGSPIEKSDLEDELRVDFETSVKDAIERVGQAMGDHFELAPVVVEKEGTKITISPVSVNGSG